MRLAAAVPQSSCTQCLYLFSFFEKKNGCNFLGSCRHLLFAPIPLQMRHFGADLKLSEHVCRALFSISVLNWKFALLEGIKAHHQKSLLDAHQIAEIKPPQITAEGSEKTRRKFDRRFRTKKSHNKFLVLKTRRLQDMLPHRGILQKRPENTFFTLLDVTHEVTPPVHFRWKWSMWLDVGGDGIFLVSSNQREFVLGSANAESLLNPANSTGPWHLAQKKTCVACTLWKRSEAEQKNNDKKLAPLVETEGTDTWKHKHSIRPHSSIGAKSEKNTLIHREHRFHQFFPWTMQGICTPLF